MAKLRRRKFPQSRKLSTVSQSEAARCMALPAMLVSAALGALPAQAQSTQLRGLPESGSSLLPSAQQQLNQNLTRQKTDFTIQRRIDQINRLNRTENLNRQSVERARRAAQDAACETPPCTGKR